MQLQHFPFQLLEWDQIEKEIHQGERGHAYWQVVHMGPIRIRKVEYSEGYLADHWCHKGHIIHCIEGEMNTELSDGRVMTLKQGMSYMVGDGSNAHRTSTKNGCKLFIVD